MTSRTIILVYELWQVDKLDTNLKGDVAAFGVDIEEALAKRGVKYISAKDYRTPNIDFRDAANTWTSLLLEDVERPFIVYRGVSLSRVFFYPLYLYFCRVAYWLDIIATLVARHPDVSKIVVYPSEHKVNETMAHLAQEEINAFVDCVKLVGVQRKISVVVSQVSTPIVRGHAVMFAIKRVLFGVVLGIWNAVMALRVRRRIRILVSDYWRNIDRIALNLPDSELVFIDRLQAIESGLKNVWKWRIRFFHMDAFTENRERNIAREDSQHFTARFRDYDVSSLLTSAYDSLMNTYVPRALREIDQAYSMLKQLMPHVIVLRISTAPQTHYPILALVGRELGTPSIEFQHGLEYNGFDSFTIRKNAQYLGVYGTITKNELSASGVSEDRIEIIGSPRFDQYAEARKQPEKLARLSEKHNILCIYPDLSYGDGFDTYDIDEYMHGIVEATHDIPNAHLIIKLRGQKREAFFRRRIADICKGISYSIEKNEPISRILLRSDMMVSCYSTAILEAMLSNVPVVVYASPPLEQRLCNDSFRAYLQADILSLAQRPLELSQAIKVLLDGDMRNSRLSHVEQFCKGAYAFDGQSAKRAAKLIRRLAGNR